MSCHAIQEQEVVLRDSPTDYAQIGALSVVGAIMALLGKIMTFLTDVTVEAGKSQLSLIKGKLDHASVQADATRDSGAAQATGESYAGILGAVGGGMSCAAGGAMIANDIKAFQEVKALGADKDTGVKLEALDKDAGEASGSATNTGVRVKSADATDTAKPDKEQIMESRRTKQAAIQAAGQGLSGMSQSFGQMADAPYKAIAANAQAKATIAGAQSDATGQLAGTADSLRGNAQGEFSKLDEFDKLMQAILASSRGA